MTTIENKWKIFSVRQCFSTELTDAQAVELFDELLKLEDSIAIEHYYRDNDHLVKWAPFEDLLDCEFVEHVEAQAKYAQMIAGTPDVYIIVESGVVSAVHSTHDMNVVVIDTDVEDYDREALEQAQSLPRAG